MQIDVAACPSEHPRICDWVNTCKRARAHDQCMLSLSMVADMEAWLCEDAALQLNADLGFSEAVYGLGSDTVAPGFAVNVCTIP